MEICEKERKKKATKMKNTLKYIHTNKPNLNMRIEILLVRVSLYGCSHFTDLGYKVKFLSVNFENVAGRFWFTAFRFNQC
jgi:hypothetical protein